MQALDAEYVILSHAWSPIGGTNLLSGRATQQHRQDPVIARLAQAHSKTPAQVMLRWHLQQGRSVIPKSTTPQRIAGNIDVSSSNSPPMSFLQSTPSPPVFGAART
jgi:diketogulonate reductase-like aldo/keto reductase